MFGREQWRRGVVWWGGRDVTTWSQPHITTSQHHNTTQGWRKGMEDAHATILRLDGCEAGSCSFFGVYDGHCGQAYVFCTQLPFAVTTTGMTRIVILIHLSVFLFR